jgi:hypothetical protein
MGEKLAFFLLLVHIQGSVEDRLKVRGGGGSVGVSLRHGEGEKRLVKGRKREHCVLRPCVLSR